MPDYTTLTVTFTTWRFGNGPACRYTSVPLADVQKLTDTHSDEREMGGGNGGLTLWQIGWNLNREVLMRGL